MQEVTITMVLRVKPNARLKDWVPASILQQLQDGEQFISYTDTETPQPDTEPTTGP